MAETTTEHNSEPLEDSNAFAALNSPNNVERAELKILVVVGRGLNPRPLRLTLHNLGKKTPTETQADHLAYYLTRDGWSKESCQ